MITRVVPSTSNVTEGSHQSQVTRFLCSKYRYEWSSVTALPQVYRAHEGSD
ncbi:hypothetical protein PISMIDRAFT_681447, partial [Pisolithus microcarpus 441]